MRGRNINRLIKLAAEARKHAYAPYSRFKVGAALRARGGKVYTGCNVENASYGLTICAERAALASAVAAGERRFTALAVVTGGREPAAPCGACRQVLAEFAVDPADLQVVMATARGRCETATLGELLPRSFRRGSLE